MLAKSPSLPATCTALALLLWESEGSAGTALLLGGAGGSSRGEPELEDRSEKMEPAREKAADMLRRNPGMPPPAESRLPVRLLEGRAIRCVTSHGAASATLSPRKRGLRREDALDVRDALPRPPVLSADGGRSSKFDENGHSHDDPSRRSMKVTRRVPRSPQASTGRTLVFLHLWNSTVRYPSNHGAADRDQLPDKDGLSPRAYPLSGPRDIMAEEAAQEHVATEEVAVAAAAAAPDTLGVHGVDAGIPAPAVQWARDLFAFFDASTNSRSQDMIRDPACGEMDLWELGGALAFGLSYVPIPLQRGREAVTDEVVMDMVRSIGKVEHTEMRITFREFVAMCWKRFFEPDPEPDDARDVSDAFEILGGGPGGEGEVLKEKVEQFVKETELTIDVDKFVGEVDEDGSGKVDYQEFRQLFGALAIDTNLHDTGEVWLRHEQDEVEQQQVKAPSGSVASSVMKADDSFIDAFVQTSVGVALSPERPPRFSGNARASRRNVRSHEDTVAFKRHRDNFFGEDAGSGSGLSNGDGWQSKKIPQSGPAKVERRRPWVNNILETSCRRGWRCSQMTRNHPTSTGYNYYYAGEIGLMELKLAGVNLRKRGAEFPVREHSSKHMNVRPSSELRCMRQHKNMYGTLTRPQTRAATATDGSSLEASLTLDSLRGTETLPHQPAYRTRKARTNNNIASRPQTSGIPRLLGSRGLTSWSASAGSDSSKAGLTRSYSYKNPERDKHWQSNMKRPPLLRHSTYQMLSLAASAGLYEGSVLPKEEPTNPMDLWHQIRTACE